MSRPRSRRRTSIKHYCEKCGRKRADVIPIIVGRSYRYQCGLCRQLGFPWALSDERREGTAEQRLSRGAPTPPLPIPQSSHAHVPMHSVVEGRKQMALGTISESAHVVDEGGGLRSPCVRDSLQIVGVDRSGALPAVPSQLVPARPIGEDQRE